MPRCTGRAVVWLDQASVPVRLYPATRDPPKIELRLLHKDCGSRLQQRYRCPRDNTVLEPAMIAKGYEVAKDRYVIISPEDLAAAEPEPDPSIDLTELVKAEDIDPVHWARPHYLGPDVESGPVQLPEADEAARRYAWLEDVLRLEGRVALGRWATRGHDLFVGLRRLTTGGLVLHELRRANEIRPFSEIGLDVPKVAAGEPALQLGLKLAEKHAAATFQPSAYPDERYTQMVLAIEAKVHNREIVASPVNGRPVVVDLLQALKASLEVGDERAGPKRAERAAAEPAKKKRATR